MVILNGYQKDPLHPCRKIRRKGKPYQRSRLRLRDKSVRSLNIVSVALSSIMLGLVLVNKVEVKVRRV